MIFVTVGRSKGTGHFNGWKFPSFMVWFASKFCFSICCTLGCDTQIIGMAIAINADCSFQRAELFSWRISNHLWLANHRCASSDTVFCIWTSCTLGEAAVSRLLHLRGSALYHGRRIVHRYSSLIQRELFDTRLLPEHRGCDFVYVVKPRETVLRIIVNRSWPKNIDLFGAQLHTNMSKQWMHRGALVHVRTLSWGTTSNLSTLVYEKRP